MAGVLYRLGRLCANRAIVVVAVWLGLVVLVRLVVDPEANSIAWLVWHLTRIQDDHVAGVAGVEQVWTSQGWGERFGLPFDPRDTGYGHRVRGIIQRS
jgi:hypothetical protein